jgi:hypothetical protein
MPVMTAGLLCKSLRDGRQWQPMSVWNGSVAPGEPAATRSAARCCRARAPSGRGLESSRAPGRTCASGTPRPRPRRCPCSWGRLRTRCRAGAGSSYRRAAARPARSSCRPPTQTWGDNLSTTIQPPYNLLKKNRSIFFAAADPNLKTSIVQSSGAWPSGTRARGRAKQPPSF